MSLTTTLALVQTALTRYVLPICLAFGFIGNLLNTIVFWQKHLRKNSCSVYFISTSVFNFLVLCFGMIPNLYSSYSSYDLALYSIAYCKFRSYMVHVLLMISRFSVALASIDRFALCSENVHIRSFSQHHRAMKAMFLACILWILIPSHILIFMNIYGQRCGANGTYLLIYSIYAAVVTIIPLLIMVIFSSLAIQGLRQIHFRVRPNTATTNSTTHSTVQIKKRDKQFVVLLIGEVIIYVTSTILFPLNTIYTVLTTSTPKNADRVAIEGFIRYLALSFLIYLNSCSIFYVHLISSHAFRHECKRAFWRIYKPSRIIQTELTAGSTSNVNVHHMIELHPMEAQ